VILSTVNLAMLSLVLLVCLLFLRWTTTQRGSETRGMKILRIALASIFTLSTDLHDL